MWHVSDIDMSSSTSTRSSTGGQQFDMSMSNRSMINYDQYWSIVMTMTYRHRHVPCQIPLPQRDIWHVDEISWLFMIIIMILSLIIMIFSWLSWSCHGIEGRKPLWHGTCRYHDINRKSWWFSWKFMTIMILIMTCHRSMWRKGIWHRHLNISSWRWLCHHHDDVDIMTCHHEIVRITFARDSTSSFSWKWHVTCRCQKWPKEGDSDIDMWSLGSFWGIVFLYTKSGQVKVILAQF